MGDLNHTDSISAHPDHFDYVVEVKGWENILDPESRFVHRVPVEEVPGLIRALVTSYESVANRQRDDAAAGDCERCGNSRMVEVVRANGSPWTEHCPVCKPKLDAIHARKGSVPTPPPPKAVSSSPFFVYGTTCHQVESGGVRPLCHSPVVSRSMAAASPSSDAWHSEPPKTIQGPGHRTPVLVKHCLQCHGAASEQGLPSCYDHPNGHAREWLSEDTRLRSLRVEGVSSPS